MYNAVLVFTGYRREEYWKAYLPGVFIYTDALKRMLPEIIKRQQLLKEKGAELTFGLILDPEYYDEQNLNIPDDLLIEVVYTSDFDTLKPIDKRVIELGKKVSAQ